MKIRIFTFLALAILMANCQDLFNPVDENFSTFDRVYQDPAFAEGLLMTAYSKVPTNSLSFNDVATDDAVSNNKLNAYRRMATGEWSALYNPLNQWYNCNSAILYLDKFISVIDTVEWKWTNSEKNLLYKKRFYGEAYALRGLFRYHLLQTVAGIDASGNLAGIPLYKDDGDFNIPRSTFDESIQEIYKDFDKSLEYFTMDYYRNISSESELPPGYSGVNIANYNDIFGSAMDQRINGIIVKAFKARVALLAASPSFSDNNTSLWGNAANFSGKVLESIGGISGLDSQGHRFYTQDQVDAINLSQNKDQKEMLWRRVIVNTNDLEKDNFPPSLFGNGNINPSQNLVNSFPMVNGLPIDNPSSGYDSNKPYNMRDPRLQLYIAFNGSTISGRPIYTGTGGGVNKKDSIATSTRTGFYLKKLLREDVSLTPTSATTKKHYVAQFRFTELFLIYAEASNEAWGPDGTGAFSFSARDVIAALRKRAGITQPDTYLSSLNSKNQMRDLIRNERRLELCFEGSRFWDLRRWNVDLTETVTGVDINGNAMNVVNVENRVYNNEFMNYGPLPQSELTKYDALVQNKGW